MLADIFSGQSTHLLWLLAGVGGLLLGLITGELILAALGLAAIITSIAALTIFSTLFQLLIWTILAVALVVVLRGLVPTPAGDLRPATNGKVLRAIAPNSVGNVSYQGSIWKARCDIPDITIDVGELVQVVGREGNTLWVTPLGVGVR